MFLSAQYADSSTPIEEYVDLFDVAADNINRTCSHFRNNTNQCVTGEATVSTFWHCKRFVKSPNGINVAPPASDSTPGLLYRLQPKAKLILILRDPVTRLVV